MLRAAATYHPSIDGAGFVLSDQAACLSSTTVLADGGIMHGSVGL